MLTPRDLRSLQLTRRPLGQRLLADLGVRPAYALRGVELVVEGIEHLLSPDPFIVAMNHTDRYNYFGLQVELHRRSRRYLASWVKGKYFEHWFSGWFMRTMSNIPVPSRGYLIAGGFKASMGRVPTSDEYRLLRAILDGDLNQPLTDATREFVRSDPARWAASVEADFDALSREVISLTGRALTAGMGVLIFPEGTRSPTLLRGRGGIAQVAQHFGVPIVPVGCSGSVDVYPGDTPWPHRGRITYRVGAPVHPEPDMRAARGFEPLTRAATRDHGDRFQAHVDLVMAHIAQLVDKRHLAVADSQQNDGVDRFI